MSHTGNPSLNSFAAEIVFHADMTEKTKFLKDPIAYDSAKKADMGVDEERDDITDDTYINDDGKYLTEQRKIFGEM